MEDHVAFTPEHLFTLQAAYQKIYKLFNVTLVTYLRKLIKLKVHFWKQV